jgi:hypothetical protein
MKGHIMALRRTQSNIVNIAFSVATEDGKSGVQISQSVVNGTSAGVSFRTLNGARKSAAINLDRAALVDLQTALSEILEGSEV